MYGGRSDCVAGEFWNEGVLGNWECRIAASSGHIYGKNMISAESFTSGGMPFERSPMSFRKRGDWSYTEGINQTVLTLFIHQPYENRKPGVNAWFGSEINRHNTWFGLSGPWMEYQRRCNFLLQQGRYVADVCYFYGEDAPKSNGMQMPSLPQGYSFDYINYDVIMNRMQVSEGRFLLPDGMYYKVMVLPESQTMRPELIEKIEQLVAAGGVILGGPPLRSPSLEGYPECDERVQKLAGELWQGLDGETEKWKRHGRGMVFRNASLEEVMENIGTPADLMIPADLQVLWIHRSLPGMEFYFLTNQGREEISFEGQFRVSGLQAEWWDAIDGSVRSLPEYEDEGSTTSIPIRLGPLESGFIVFRKDPEDKSHEVPVKNFPTFRPIREIEGPWAVRFYDPIGESFNLSFDDLQDWSRSPDERLRQFSGTALYRTEFVFEGTAGEDKVFLNLGKVNVIARVILNGKTAGGLWTSPWRLDVSEFLVEGRNTLEVELANTWLNRLVADKQPGKKDRKSWLTLDNISPSQPLQPAGLLGPIHLEHIEDHVSK
jgi:hypothetical protein